MSPYSVSLVKRMLWSKSNCQDLIFLPKDNFCQTNCLMILVFWHYFFSKPDKDYFEQKEVPSANSFAISLLTSPSALNLSFLSHSVCPYHVFPLFSSFLLLSSFHFAYTNSICFAFILHLISCLCSLHSFDRRHPALCFASH